MLKRFRLKKHLLGLPDQGEVMTMDGSEKIMRQELLVSEYRPWQTVILAPALIIMLLSLLMIARPDIAGADSGSIGVPSDTLTIKVGYFGGPYYTKKTYTISDLEAMPQVQQAYTYIDSMPAVVIDSARGVKLADLLEDAGIDVNSVESFYFYATDTEVGWYQCLPKSYLLDTARYYYPNLPAYWDSDTHSSIPGAALGAIQVEPVVAIWDNWQRFAVAPDFNVRDTSTRFRLLFGQTDTAARTAMRSVRWVHAIEVMLGGSPPSRVTLDQNVVNLKVGSTFRLTATVGPEDATDKSVIWSSSDTGVAEVDDNGLVTVVGPGTATITVSTVIGNMTDICVVNDPNRPAVGAAVSSGSSEQEKEVQEKPAGTLQPETNLHYLAEKEAAATDAGSQPWRVFEMSADAVPLQKQEEQGNLDIITALVFLSLVVFGAGKRYSEYVKET